MGSEFFVQYVTFFYVTTNLRRIQNFHKHFYFYSCKSIELIALQLIYNHYHDNSNITKNPTDFTNHGFCCGQAQLAVQNLP